MPDGIDTEYLVELLRQVRDKNNDIKYHVNKKGFFNHPGLLLNKDYIFFEYLQEKTQMIDMLLNTIQKDILLKSGRLRTLEN